MKTKILLFYYHDIFFIFQLRDRLVIKSDQRDLGRTNYFEVKSFNKRNVVLKTSHSVCA